MKNLYTVILILSMYSTSNCTFDANNMHRYFLANYYQFGNNKAQAQQWYSAITDTDSQYMHAGFIPFLADLGKHHEIVELIPRLDPIFKKNEQVQLIFAHALEQVGESKNAQERLIMMHNQFKNNQEIAFRVAQLYAERQEPENAIMVIDSLLNSSSKPNNFIFLFLKAQIYLKIGNTEQARQTLKTCMEKYPRFDKAWLMHAMLEEQAGNLEKAVKGYTVFLETTHEHAGEIQQHLRILASRNKLSLHSHLSTDPEKQLESLEILIAQKKYDEALNHLKKWINQTKDKDQELPIKTLHLLNQTALDPHALNNAFDELLKQQPKNLTLTLYAADVALKQNALTRAQTLLKKSFELTQDPLLQTKISFQQGLCAWQQGHFDEAQAYLQKGHRLKQDYPPLLNLLAYSLATQEKKLEHALPFITKALEKDPHNPHFLDTHAVILYKQKDYKAAQAVWECSMGLCSDDATIYTHASKNYYKLGNIQQAVANLHKAQKYAQTQEHTNKINHLFDRWKLSNHE